MEYFPFISVATPTLSPLIKTETPGNVTPCSSFTVPFTTFFFCCSLFPSPFWRIKITLLKNSYSKLTLPNTILSTSFNSLFSTFTEIFPAWRIRDELYMNLSDVCCLTAFTNCSTDTSDKSSDTIFFWEYTFADKFKVNKQIKAIHHFIIIKFFLYLFNRPGNLINRFFFILL